MENKTFTNHHIVFIIQDGAVAMLSVITVYIHEQGAGLGPHYKTLLCSNMASNNSVN